eukprot:Pgem_evm1s3676
MCFISNIIRPTTVYSLTNTLDSIAPTRNSLETDKELWTFETDAGTILQKEVSKIKDEIY